MTASCRAACGKRARHPARTSCLWNSRSQLNLAGESDGNSSAEEELMQPAVTQPPLTATSTSAAAPIRHHVFFFFIPLSYFPNSVFRGTLNIFIITESTQLSVTLTPALAVSVCDPAGSAAVHHNSIFVSFLFLVLQLCSQYSTEWGRTAAWQSRHYYFCW